VPDEFSIGSSFWNSGEGLHAVEPGTPNFLRGDPLRPCRPFAESPRRWSKSFGDGATPATDEGTTVRRCCRRSTAKITRLRG
jgi:hypothetical protein